MPLIEKLLKNKQMTKIISVSSLKFRSKGKSIFGVSRNLLIWLDFVLVVHDIFQDLIEIPLEFVTLH